VVVEAAGQAGLVGMGTVRFSSVQFNGKTWPLAFLDGLKVHENFRRQGLGYQIANWRVQHAREVFGDQGVIATGMLQDNGASYAVAKKWCREFIEPAFEVLIVPMRAQPPRAVAGVKLCELEPRQYEEFAARQNRFYEAYNLYPPSDPQAIARARAVNADGRQPYRYWAAVDSRGNLLAGAQAWARGLLKSDTVNNPPAPLRLLNGALHLFPADFTIRDLAVNGLWHAPDHLAAGRWLWEMIRWTGKDQGTTLTIGFDLRDPARQCVRLRPWHQPRLKITLAVHGPTPINREQLVFSAGRV
jgi:hypothetical protein